MVEDGRGSTFKTLSSLIGELGWEANSLVIKLPNNILIVYCNYLTQFWPIDLDITLQAIEQADSKIIIPKDM